MAGNLTDANCPFPRSARNDVAYRPTNHAKARRNAPWGFSIGHHAAYLCNVAFRKLGMSVPLAISMAILLYGVLVVVVQGAKEQVRWVDAGGAVALVAHNQTARYGASGVVLPRNVAGLNVFPVEAKPPVAIRVGASPIPTSAEGRIGGERPILGNVLPESFHQWSNYGSRRDHEFCNEVLGITAKAGAANRHDLTFCWDGSDGYFVYEAEGRYCGIHVPTNWVSAVYRAGPYPAIADGGIARKRPLFVDAVPQSFLDGFACAGASTWGRAKLTIAFGDLKGPNEKDVSAVPTSSLYVTMAFHSQLLFAGDSPPALQSAGAFLMSPHYNKQAAMWGGV